MDGHRAIPDLLATVRELAIPRAAGSPGDERVRARLRELLREAGLEVDEDEVRYRRGGPILAYRLAMAALAGACALGWKGRKKPPEIVATGTAAAAGFALLRSLLRVDRLFEHGQRETETANLVARFPVEEPERRVVLVAHHDSKSQNIPLAARGALVAAGAAGLAGTVLSWLSPDDSTGDDLGRFLAGAGALSFLGLAALSFGNESPGAIDNAGSLAVALEVARRFVADPPPWTELVVVFTGGEEDMLAGVRELARGEALGWDLEPTLVINLDGVGGPGPVGVVGHDPAVGWVLDRASEAGIGARRICLPPGAATDATILERVCRRVVTLTSGKLSPAILAIHSRRDMPENLDPGALVEAADLLEVLARAWAEGRA